MRKVSLSKNASNRSITQVLNPVNFESKSKSKADIDIKKLIIEEIDTIPESSEKDTIIPNMINMKTPYFPKAVPASTPQNMQVTFTSD